MQLTMELGGCRCLVLHENAVSVGISLNLARSNDNQERVDQPVHFDAEPAAAKPYRSGDFVGDLVQGGSCTVEQLHLTPHCNGTHTETRLHIAEDGWTVAKSLTQLGAFVTPASLITVSPVSAQDTEDSYVPEMVSTDRVITRATLAAACDSVPDEFLQAVLIRTLPNEQGKQREQYTAAMAPAFLSLSAAEYLVERGVEHLLVDVPSVDRYHDEGKLSVHHIFLAACRPLATITEMIYAPNCLPDGPYLLNLHCPSFDTDAVPSRPVLLPLEVMS
jgi:kynurenine formamidase